MARLCEEKKERARDVAMIVGGLTVAFLFLMIICTIVIGAPMMCICALFGMMGPR